MNLSACSKISQAITVTNGAAGSDDIEGATLDMTGYEGVLMVVTFGAIVTGAATAISAQMGVESNASDMAALAGTGQTIADDADGKTFYIDLYRPTERYVRLHVDRATQNATVAEALYIQYGARTNPVTHGTNVTGELHVSPAEGTI